MTDKTTKEPDEQKKSDENNAKCSFCGNDTYCEPCLITPADAGKFEHMCYGCFQKMGAIPENVRDKTHLCLTKEERAQQFQRFMEQTIKQGFDQLWAGEKKNLRSLSKQELAEVAFFEGARFMFEVMQRMETAQTEPEKKK